MERATLESEHFLQSLKTACAGSLDDVRCWFESFECLGCKLWNPNFGCFHSTIQRLTMLASTISRVISGHQRCSIREREGERVSTVSKRIEKDWASIGPLARSSNRGSWMKNLTFILQISLGEQVSQFYTEWSERSRQTWKNKNRNSRASIDFLRIKSKFERIFCEDSGSLSRIEKRENCGQMRFTRCRSSSVSFVCRS